jgi:predicted transglutaminase-like cysteine proteinase
MPIDPNFFRGYTILPLRDGDADLAKWRAVLSAGLFFDGVNHFGSADLAHLNEAINRTITYTPDVVDNWQTPRQTWEIRRGDCEDIAILKYAVLRNRGFAEGDLALVLGNLRNATREGHAFLVCAGNVLDVKFDQIIRITEYMNFDPAKWLAASETWLLGRQVVIGGR